MKGRHFIEIRNNRSVYKLVFERNLSVITGKSATGKTTLINLIRNFDLYGPDSGITIKSDKRCVVLDNAEWKLILENTHDSIVFIDEGRDFISTVAFAGIVKKSDNYYVIITRENLYNLPVSVDAIYGLHGRRYFNLKKTYNSLYRIYPDREPAVLPDHILTEDSNSGYQFFCKIAESSKIQCSSANGNSNLLSEVKTMENKTVLVIADGAAFGPYMEMMSDYQRQSQNRILLYVPESFEWIILSSGLIPDSEIEKILAAPYDYIDSSQFFSWENYFTALLVEKTKDSYLRYSKSVLNDAYLQEHEKLAILSVLPDVISESFKGSERK